MKFPFSITLFHKEILLHMVIEPVAFFIGYRYYVYLKKAKGDHIEIQNRISIILGAALGALIGSRLIGGLENIPEMLKSSNKLLYFFQNRTVLGGFLGGVSGVELTKKIIGEKQNSGDLFVYPILLALIIGRIGCFSMGIYEETYGLPTSFFTGMNLGDGVLRHPVTIYEIIFLLLLWIFLKQIDKKYLLANGLLFKLFIIAYCFFRFFLDFIKPHYSWIGLSIIQLTCIAGLIYYSILSVCNKKAFSLRKKY